MNIINETALRVAVIGAGHEATHLARNFAMSTDWELVAVCDMDRSRAERLATETGSPAVVSSVEELLSEHEVDAVAIAAPAQLRQKVAMQAIDANKHVLISRSLADSVAAGIDMVTAAESSGTVLMVAHSDCYTPAVIKIRELLAGGELGEILYVDSVRIDSSTVQPDTDVFWDQAPHDLSILDFILPGGLDSQSVSAQGADPLRSGKACVGYLSLPLANNALAHIHVNWLSPTRVQQMVIGGSRKTLVWDDLNPQHRLSLVERGDPLHQGREAGLGIAGPSATTTYQLQDARTLALGESKPFTLMASSFAAAIRGSQPAPTDGRSGLRVLSVLESAATSLQHGGAVTMISDTGAVPRPGGKVAAADSASEGHRTGRAGHR